MTKDFGIQVYDRWVAFWNGDVALADEIMAPAFTLRYAQPGASAYDDIKHPAQFAKAIAAFHDDRPGLRFAAEGEPVVDPAAGLVARPYRASYTNADGREISVSGTDILKYVDGRIIEVWSVSGGIGGRTFYR